MKGLQFGVSGAVFAAQFVLPGCDRAELLQASSGDVGCKIAGAEHGGALMLEPGDYRNPAISGRSFSPDLTIKAGDAIITNAALTRIEGVTLRGGVFRLEPAAPGEKDVRAAILMRNVADVKVLGGRFPGHGSPEGPRGRNFGKGYGVCILRGRGVEVADGRFEGFRIGVPTTRVDRFQLPGNTFVGMRADGVATSLSRNGLIEKNNCKSTCGRGKDHADCIQMWSRPNALPSAEVVFRAIHIKGSAQRVGPHSNICEGVHCGGLDRIVIQENVINLPQAIAINLKNARSSIVRNNDIYTAPSGQVHATIRTCGRSATACGNTDRRSGRRARWKRPRVLRTWQHT